MCHAFLHTCIIVFLPNLDETGSSTLKWLAFYTCLTFSPSWINEGFSLNEEIMWEKIAMRRRDTCFTSGLKLPQARFFFLPSFLCRREIERRGERRRPQVTFLDYQLNAWGEWERKKEREWRRREVGIGWGKGKGVEKRSDVFISFRLCLVAAGSGFSPHLVAHCLVTAKCVKTPPTTSWRPREREQGSLS